MIFGELLRDVLTRKDDSAFWWTEFTAILHDVALQNGFTEEVLASIRRRLEQAKDPAVEALEMIKDTHAFMNGRMEDASTEVRLTFLNDNFIVVYLYYCVIKELL